MCVMWIGHRCDWYHGDSSIDVITDIRRPVPKFVSHLSFFEPLNEQTMINILLFRCMRLLAPYLVHPNPNASTNESKSQKVLNLSTKDMTKNVFKCFSLSLKPPKNPDQQRKKEHGWGHHDLIMMKWKLP